MQPASATASRAAASTAPRRRADRGPADMPRRQSIPRMTKYHAEPANRTTARFTAKLMANGRRNLSDRILRQALARAEAQAHRPGLEVLEAALRNATPIIEVKPRRACGAHYQLSGGVRGDSRVRV